MSRSPASEKRRQMNVYFRVKESDAESDSHSKGKHLRAKGRDYHGGSKN